MVNPINPIYLFVVFLSVAFLMTLIDKIGRKLSSVVFISTLGFVLFETILWGLKFFNGTAKAFYINTAGFKPPFSIALKMGQYEAFFILLINTVGLLGGIYLLKKLNRTGPYSFILFLMVIMGANGMVLTADLFNLFVFTEITSIATYSLIGMDRNHLTLSAGFKYIIAGSIASALFLLGTIYLYRFTGVLSINGIFQAKELIVGKAGLVAIVFLFSALVIELKVFPINGWALDVYESVDPGIAAILSGATVAASYFVLSKILPIFGAQWYTVTAWIGIITFVASSLFGLKQKDSRRLLGYSSLGQVGLLLVILGFSTQLGDKRDFIAFGIIISHYFAKVGLFWIAGIIKSKKIKEWSILRKKPILLVLFGSFLFALIGFPPFPSFFAKWELVLIFMKSKMFIWVFLILFSSFIEAFYLFRWFGYALKLDNEESPEIEMGLSQLFPVVIFGLLLYGAGYYSSTLLDSAKGLDYIPLIFVAFIGLIDVFPAWVKNTFSIAGVIAYSYYLFPFFKGDTLKMIFLFVFLGGAVITLFSGYYAKGRREGFHALALIMFAGMVMLLKADNLMIFLYGWELMSIGSYFLLIRGKKSMPHGFSYMIFSIGGSYAIMFAFGLAFAGSGSIAMSALKDIAIYPALAYSLMLIGFMTKTASIGFHIWLPGAHGEAVADIHFMASAILLKAGVYGIIVVLLAMGTESHYAKIILYSLGWIGALSALLGNLTAVFQESAKRLLAWSSIGQIGYIIFALASMSYIGWVGGLFYTIAHFLYKGVLFLIIGGIALKLGTPYMYKMGGLIKRMPFSFIAVLIAIITLAGVPPLVGFSGKWLFYNIILMKHLYLQGTVVMVSGIIAFVYLFRLIHTIFLGQLKDEHRNIGEISIWLLIPVYLLLAGIMFFSMHPKKLLKPLGDLAQKYFPTNAIHWTGTKAVTTFGYFDGTWIMYTVIVIFLVIFAWLLYRTRDTHKAGQFNIVFSGESPSRPETTHYAYNFAAPFRKAIGILVEPFVDTFWNWVIDSIHAVADFFRKIYTGNGQTYALQIILFVLFVYLIVGGGF